MTERRQAMFLYSTNPRIKLIVQKTWGTDTHYWPKRTAITNSFPITTVSTDGLTLQLVADCPLPSHAATLIGAEAPALMLWNVEISRWARLDVASVTDSAPSSTTARTFTIQLNSQPTMYSADGRARATPTIQVGDALSPATDCAEAIAVAIESHFDNLGPGELVPAYDPRYQRAARQPYEPSRRSSPPAACWTTWPRSWARA